MEIAGLFETSGDSTEMFSNWSMENSIFTTRSDLHQARPTNAEESYESIRFYARDPADVEDMINAMKALPLMEDGDFTVSADTASVDAVMEPLKNMEHLVTALILLILCVGAAVLYLVLSGGSGNGAMKPEFSWPWESPDGRFFCSTCVKCC